MIILYYQKYKGNNKFYKKGLMSNNLLKLSICCFCSLLIFKTTNAQNEQAEESLRSQFKHPPMEAWPKNYWWWLNGNVDTVRAKEEIRAMKAAGLSGFDIFEIGVPKEDKMVEAGPAFLSEESLKAIKVALEEAEKLDMRVGLNMASSWNAGGSWIVPEHAAKSIYFSKTHYNGKVMKLPFPELVRKKKKGKIDLEEDQRNPNITYNENGRPVYYREIVVLAIPVDSEGAKTIDVNDVIDVTPFFNSETEKLNWNHSGEYDIYRYVCSNSGELLKLPSKNSVGPIIDHFDAGATEAHFAYVINKLKTIIDGDFRSSPLKSLYLASYEALGNVWTGTLPEKFKALNGYDIYKYIPALFDGDIFPNEVAKKVERDFQYTLSELMIDNFYRKAKEISNANGLLINSESGGPGFPLHNVPVEPLKSLGVMDLPRGEFWINHNRLNDDGIDILRVVKEASSASHIYDRGIVEEEAFTTFQHWQEGPFDMKPMGDRAFCEGMNKVVVHGSSHNPRGTGFPGIVYHAGTHYNDKRVWWPMVKPFNEYLSRISHVLQKTDFVADVLYYYGSAVPNFTGHKNGRFNVGPGFDYEVINTEILKQLTVRDGQLILPTGERFKLLAMEEEVEIDPEVLLKLKELTAKGAKVISEKPKKVIERRNLPELKVSSKDINALWSNSNEKNTKGKVLSGITPIAMLEKMKVGPDIDYHDLEFGTLDYIHYKKGDEDYYLMRNTTGQWVSRQCSFRQTGKSPEIWDPVTGEISPVAIYENRSERTDLPLTFPPYGAMFIVFSPGNTFPTYTKINSEKLSPPKLQYDPSGILFLENGKFDLINKVDSVMVSNYVKQISVDGSWEVFFPKEQGAPQRAIFSELTSWTNSEMEEIKYFSGIAKYVKTFQYDINSTDLEGKKVYLDLGNLSKVGKVWLNDKSLGVVWAKPYRLDITDVLRPGDNLLEVEVANTWSNRLTGDAITGQEFTNTNIPSTNIDGLNKIRLPWKDVPLIKSGLLGPVTIEFIEPVN